MDRWLNAATGYHGSKLNEIFCSSISYGDWFLPTTTNQLPMMVNTHSLREHWVFGGNEVWSRWKGIERNGKRFYLLLLDRYQCHGTLKCARVFVCDWIIIVCARIHKYSVNWTIAMLFNADESTKMTPLIERKMKKITHRGEPNITCVFNFVLYLFVGTTGYWIWNSFHFQS